MSSVNVQFTDAYQHADHQQTGYWQPLALEPVVPAGQNPLYEGLTIHLDQHSPGTIQGRPGQSRLGEPDTLEQSGTRLRRYYGARLRREGTQGLTGTTRENTLEPRAAGGADLVHSRAREGTITLVLDIRQPSKQRLDEMVSLVDHMCTWYQYQQLRTITTDGRELTKRLVYREGLENPTHHSPGTATFALTFDDVDAYWYAPIRPQVKQLDPPEKKFITAYEGVPDPDGPPAVTYSWEGEPHASSSVKRVDGEVVARNLMPSPRYIDDSYSISNVDIEQSDGQSLNQITTTGGGTSYTGKTQFDVEPGQWFGSALSFEWGEGIGRVRHQVQFRGPDNESIDAPQAQSDLSDHPGGGRSITAWEVPDGATEARIYSWYYLEGTFTTAPEGSTVYIGEYSVAVADSEDAALAQIEEYFDGDTPNETSNKGGYELPFFPVWISGSTVQDQLEVRNQSDYPLWLKYEFTGPGEDPQVRLVRLGPNTIPEDEQPTILVETSTDNGVIIDSTEGVQLVYRERSDGTYENLFPNTTSMDWFSIPARTTAHIHVSVVGATPETRVRVTGYEKTTNSGLY